MSAGRGPYSSHFVFVRLLQLLCLKALTEHHIAATVFVVLPIDTQPRGIFTSDPTTHLAQHSSLKSPSRKWAQRPP
ncbi:hypothetical protein K461DRAFT_281256 [Myriangium duriaei CBS 260.36]|uniref:Secreted protein n=1 Tax=Myriangium duriaei CBS 260.36 TaxID=1168546 RepID=A0A9P4MEA8_9PEZI|nr:hypothetical protein K461DRAFT_281256 [Myriangium duriaei CBS 260.36]